MNKPKHEYEKKLPTKRPYEKIEPTKRPLEQKVTKTYKPLTKKK